VLKERCYRDSLPGVEAEYREIRSGKGVSSNGGS
jgi:hypothetical protein